MQCEHTSLADLLLSPRCHRLHVKVTKQRIVSRCHLPVNCSSNLCYSAGERFAQGVLANCSLYVLTAYERSRCVTYTDHLISKMWVVAPLVFAIQGLAFVYHSSL